MKDSNLSSAYCLIVEAISFDKSFMCKLKQLRDPPNTLKKPEDNEIIGCKITLSHFWLKLIVYYVGFVTCKFSKVLTV